MIDPERGIQLQKILQPQLNAMRKIKASQSHITTEPTRQVTPMATYAETIFSTNELEKHRILAERYKEKKEKRMTTTSP